MQKEILHASAEWSLKAARATNTRLATLLFCACIKPQGDGAATPLIVPELIKSLYKILIKSAPLISKTTSTEIDRLLLNARISLGRF